MGTAMKRFAVLATIWLCACGQEEVSNGGASPSAPLNQGSSAAASDARTQLVPDFPGSTPVEIPNLGAPGTDTRSGNSTARETDANPDEVARFYREHFQRTGMTVRTDTADAEGGLIAVGRDGERGAMLTISRIGAKTRIAVMMGPR
jgi:hypothetical protein